jgi:ABC-type methionine transport system ATPase subunit
VGTVETRRIKLTFPERLIKEPVLFTVAKRFDVMPNIRRAKVSESAGEIVLEISGEEESLQEAIAYFEQVGVEVEPISGDIIAG